MTSKEPILTFILATYNEVSNISRIKQTIKFLKTWEKIQLIIVDGNSNDGTRKILSKIKGIDFISETDSGIYDAWNKGLRFAKGVYISFIGSTDIPGADFINNFLFHYENDFHNEKPPLLIIGNAVRTLGKKKRYINVSSVPSIFRSVPNKKVFGFVHQGSFNHKELFNDHFNLKYQLASDLEFYIRNREVIACRIMKLNKIQVYADYNGLSTSLKALKIYRNEIKMIENTYSVLLKKPSKFKIFLSSILNEKSFLGLRRIKWFILNSQQD